jgi:Fe-S-cluster-containing dehydrogenase component
LCGSNALASETHTGNPDRYGVLVDLSLCSGCRTCEAACYEENKNRDTNRRTDNEHEGNLPPPRVPFDDLSVTATRRRPSGGVYTVVNRYQAQGATGQDRNVYRKLQCFHCDEPACASACFVSALTKTKEGAVVYNPNVCVGCRYCMTACPFSIPGYEYDNPLTPRVKKCTFCYHRTSVGRPPACVEACPYGVMTFGKRSDLVRFANEKILAHPERYVHQIYGENEVGGTAWMYLSPVAFDQVGFRTDLGTTPYPELTRGFLSIVPPVLVLWGPALMGVYAFTQRKEKLAEREKRDAVGTAVASAVAAAEQKAAKQFEAAMKKADKERELAVKKAVEETKKATAEQEAK